MLLKLDLLEIIQGDFNVMLLSSQHLKGDGYWSLAKEITRTFNKLLKHAKTRKQKGTTCDSEQ